MNCLLFAAALIYSNLGYAQEQVPSTEAEQTAEIPKPARVVGQPQSPEEWQAWQAVEQAPALMERAVLAERFLQTFPESGLTPFAHQILARNYYQSNDLNNFVKHAELALAELPDNPDLLTPLAFVYSEKGQATKAVAKAEAALQLMESLAVPAGVTPIDWVTQREQLQADCYYALGRAHLNRFTSTATTSSDPESRRQNPNLLSSIDYFHKALHLNPRHDFAYFRLAFAERNANHPEEALRAYAGAIAVGGVAAGPAQTEIQKIHAFIQENLKDSPLAQKSVDQFLQEERERIEKETEEKTQRLAQSAQAIQQQLEQSAQPSPAQDTPPQDAPPPPPGS